MTATELAQAERAATKVVDGMEWLNGADLMREIDAISRARTRTGGIKI